MSENNTQKMITDAIFKSAIEKILTEISDYIYVEEPYTKPEIDDMFDATSQEIDYYSSLINDGMISENRLWSAKKISEELAKCILESNAYTDGLLSNISSIELKYVTSLPVDNISSNTIYILKSSLETEPDTLNLYDGTQWTEIGKFEFDMSGYVTTDDMNTELAKKANNKEVVKVSDIITDTTGASNNNVLSASVTVTEIGKKVNKTDIIDNLTSTNTDKPLSAKQGKALDDKKLNKADFDKIILINIDSVNIKDYILENCIDENKIYYIAARSNCTDIPKDNTNYFMTVEKVGSFTIKVTAKELAASNNEYVCTYRTDNPKWTNWEKVCTTKIADVPRTPIVSEDSNINFGSRSIYSVKNGICYVSLWDVAFSEVGLGKLVKQNLPKTDHFVSVPIIAANNNGDLVGYAYIDDGFNLRIHVYKTGLTGYASLSYPVAES